MPEKSQMVPLMPQPNARVRLLVARLRVYANVNNSAGREHCEIYSARNRISAGDVLSK